MSKENKKFLTELTREHKIKNKYYGLNALKKIKELFFPNNKKEADKWAKRWTLNEKKNSVYVEYLVKKRVHTYLYTRFIIGEGKRRSVLGERGVRV